MGDKSCQQGQSKLDTVVDDLFDSLSLILFIMELLQNSQIFSRSLYFTSDVITASKCIVLITSSLNGLKILDSSFCLRSSVGEKLQQSHRKKYSGSLGSTRDD